jgi:predicted nucleic acid-binding protein
MTAVYLESSALLAWLLGEPTEQRVREELDAVSSVLTSVLSTLESERAITRLEVEETVAAAQAQHLRGLLRRTTATCIQMEITAAVRERVGRGFPVEPVRTLDAIHLATALEFALAFDDLRVLSFDRRLRDNAEALGLACTG